MKLKMVTFEIDLTQFLVDEQYGDPITQAIEANLDDKYLDKFDEEDVEDILDRNSYEVWDINNMEDLGYIMERTDYIGRYKNVLIFNG